jgi:hypothetical protein
MKEEAAMIELTEEQLRALAAEGEPPMVIDPRTKQQYRLVPADAAERTGLSAPVGEMPQGVRASREALLRDLPELLKSHGGQCVCYHGGRRIGIGHEADLIRACQKLGLKGHEYYIGVIEERELIEEEEIDVFRPDLVEDPDIPCQSS